MLHPIYTWATLLEPSSFTFFSILCLWPKADTPIVWRASLVMSTSTSIVISSFSKSSHKCSSLRLWSTSCTANTLLYDFCDKHDKRRKTQTWSRLLQGWRCSYCLVGRGSSWWCRHLWLVLDWHLRYWTKFLTHRPTFYTKWPLEIASSSSHPISIGTSSSLPAISLLDLVVPVCCAIAYSSFALGVTIPHPLGRGLLY